MKTIAQITGAMNVDHILFRDKERESFGPAGRQILGVEIEVENLPRGIGYYEDLLHPAWGVKTDNSLRGAAAEFITNPMRAEELLPTLRRFYEATGFTQQNFTDRCSIHVHANVQDFTVDQLACLTLMYQTVEDIFFEFVGQYRDTNLYCIPWSQCRMSYKIVPRMFRGDGHFVECLRGWQKYTALNLLPVTVQGTVEFRHMHGSADLEKIKTWVLLISNLMYAAKSTSFDETLNTIKDLNTSSQYQGWFEKLVQGALPYNERYRPQLAQGIVNAKYSFLTLDPKKPVKEDMWMLYSPGLAPLHNAGDEPQATTQVGIARERLLNTINRLNERPTIEAAPQQAQRVEVNPQPTTGTIAGNGTNRQFDRWGVRWDDIFAEEVRRQRDAALREAQQNIPRPRQPR